ncbi:hypothetical protein [Streptomyces sp. NPDC008125]|uniref:hypothetical protein n=1 Tax=Streptomyces sp. NPDC008125 TaxID=3364811 RepID=UPI0036EBD6CD
MPRKELDVLVPAVVRLRCPPNVVSEGGQASSVTLDQQAAVLPVDPPTDARAAGVHHLDRSESGATETRFGRGSGFHAAPTGGKDEGHADEVARPAGNVDPGVTGNEQNPHPCDDPPGSAAPRDEKKASPPSAGLSRLRLSRHAH